MPRQLGLQGAAQTGCASQGFDLSGVDVEVLCSSCELPGIGVPVGAMPGGQLPAVWELQQAAMAPPLICVHRLGHIASCLQSFTDAAVASVRAAMAEHLRATVGRVLAMEGASESTQGMPTAQSLEEQLRGMKPLSGITILQSMALLLEVLLWFYRGCSILVSSALQSATVRSLTIMCLVRRNECVAPYSIRGRRPC
jgi:hypothetical protein